VDPDGRAFELMFAVAGAAGADAAVLEPTDVAAPAKAAGYAGALIGAAIGGTIYWAVEAVTGEGESSDATDAPANDGNQLEEAEKARDALADEIGGSKAMVTGGVNVETGQVAACANGGGKCAEDNVVEELGGDSSKIKFTTPIRPKTKEEKPVCERCEQRYGRDKFPDRTRFRSDELPKQK
jgi:hypothetical protein